MRVLLLTLVFALPSCRSHAQLDQGLAEALLTSNGTDEVRIYAANHWAAPMDYLLLPAPVRRTAEFVQPDGEVVYAARISHGTDSRYLVEKRYGDTDLRSVQVSDGGEVLVRSHTITKPDFPPAVLESLRSVTALAILRYEVFLGTEQHGILGPWYRATYGADGIARMYATCYPATGEVTQTPIQTARILFSRPIR